jgi:hypothetical protein
MIHTHTQHLKTHAIMTLHTHNDIDVRIMIIYTDIQRCHLQVYNDDTHRRIMIHTHTQHLKTHAIMTLYTHNDIDVRIMIIYTDI